MRNDFRESAGCALPNHSIIIFQIGLCHSLYTLKWVYNNRDYKSMILIKTAWILLYIYLNLRVMTKLSLRLDNPA